MSTPVKQLLDQKGHDVIGIGTSESVFEALGQMVTNHIGCLLVYNKQTGLWESCRSVMSSNTSARRRS